MQGTSCAATSAPAGRGSVARKAAQTEIPVRKGQGRVNSANHTAAAAAMALASWAFT